MTERYQATYSSTPASVIYAQSWPFPSVRKKYPENLARYNSPSNNHRKNFNSTWIKEENRRRAERPVSHQDNGCTEKRTRSWAKSMLKSHYPEWTEEDAHFKLDMAKEFRLTLKMFRKLTQQVKEVDERMNSNKNPYSFKHHANNQDSPGLYRSQLHLAVNKRNYTPQPLTTLKEKVENKPRPWSHLGVHTSKSHEYFNFISKPNIEEKAQSDDAGIFQKESKTAKAEQKKAFEKHRLDKERLYRCDNCEINWPSDEKENDSLGYIDPVPSDWSERKLEELEEDVSFKEKEADPFMLRYFQLRRLEAETIENEKCPQKTEETSDTLSSQNGSMKTAMKTVNTNKKQVNKIYSANGKNSKSRDDCRIGKKSDKNFRKCTSFKSDIEYDKCSPLKSDLAQRLEKDVGSEKEKKNSGTVNSISKKSKCLSARVRRDCNSNATSSKDLNSCKKSEHYDIVELATTFEPPSKDRICSKSRPVTAKSAKSKGLLPGKSWHSQRRFSLTDDQTYQPVTSDVPLTKPKSSKSRQKSAKRKTKRCASSKF